MPILPLMIGITAYGVYKLGQKYRKIMIGISIFIIGISLLFLSVWNSIYQIGALPLMDYLRTKKNSESIYFFTNCHATPFYSHIHKNITMDFPVCPPSLAKDYVSESHKLFLQPEAFVEDILKNKQYSHLVVHGAIEAKILPILNRYKYIKVIDN